MSIQAQVLCLVNFAWQDKYPIYANSKTLDSIQQLWVYFVCFASARRLAAFFFTSMFISRVWSYLQISWHHGGNVAQVLKHAKLSFQGPCFTEIVILACWAIWKQRNGWIFKNIKPTFRGWKAYFVQEVSLLKYRAKSVDMPLLSSWLDNLH